MCRAPCSCLLCVSAVKVSMGVLLIALSLWASKSPALTNRLTSKVRPVHKVRGMTNGDSQSTSLSTTLLQSIASQQSHAKEGPSTTSTTTAKPDPKLRAAKQLVNQMKTKNHAGEKFTADVPNTTLCDQRHSSLIDVRLTDNLKDSMFPYLMSIMNCYLRCRLKNEVRIIEEVQQLIDKYHFKTCAVVSSSGAMMKHRFGADIDKTDAVLRFGLAPSGGKWTLRVGKKETVRMVNSKIYETQVAHDRPGITGLSYQHDQNPEVIVTNIEANRKPQWKGIVHLDIARLDLRYVLARTFRGVLQDGHHISAGMTGIWLMMHMCDQVTIYEMVPGALSHVSNYHYFDNEGGRGNKNYWHDTMPFEWAFWRVLAGSAGLDGELKLSGFSREICPNG